MYPRIAHQPADWQSDGSRAAQLLRVPDYGGGVDRGEQLVP
ncbi:hypothetical protein OG558_25845 [Kribbella sp. NBC_01510]